MIILDLEMPESCEECELQYVCSIIQNTGVTERVKLKLDKNRHPDCMIKGIAHTETTVPTSSAAYSAVFV